MPGLSQRFLLVTAVVLLHGWALTILGASLVLAVLSAIGIADWASLRPNLLCTVTVPALFAPRLQEIGHRRLPLMTFGEAIINGMLSASAASDPCGLGKGLPSKAQCRR